jgi:hypothetical protein
MKTLHNTKNYIYIIREGGKKKKNYFKIGSSKDVVNSHNQRIVNIQIGNPRKLFLLKKIYNENSFKLEHFLHQCIIEFHHRGEWFHLNQELLLNKLEENIDAFTNLNSTEINKIKSPLKSFSNSKIAKEANQRSAEKRRRLTDEWQKRINLKQEIIDAIKLLKKPTLERVSQLLNSRGLTTIRGSKFNKNHVLVQIRKMGFKNLKTMIINTNENLT